MGRTKSEGLKMNNNLLPAYVVFRVLGNQKTSIKEVLISFMTSFIKNDFQRNTFLINDFTPKFNSYYGFNIPSTVIKNVLSENRQITLSKGGWYKLDKKLIAEENAFELDNYKSEIDLLTQDFLDYSKRQGYTDSKTLISDFTLYFSDSWNRRNNLPLISKYIISKQTSDSKFKRLLDDLNYGSIIYRGITMDLSEIKSWDKELVIYLNTDILFDIFGLNGKYYQQAVSEFLSLVHEINNKREYIKLMYLNLTKTEIHRFFHAAKRILCDKNQLSQSEGMDNLLSRCAEYADIAEQEGLFFSELKKHSIVYDEVNIIDFLNEDSIDGVEEKYIDKNFSFFDFTDDYLNFIEKLRDGHKSKSLSDSKYIFITRTESILCKSREKNIITQGIRLAPSLEYVITTLWFNLNKGFGVSQLQSLDIVLKSKKIYAGIVADEKMKKIAEAKSAFNRQELSSEQAYEIIGCFKQMSSKPEDISQEIIENVERLRNKTLNQILESTAIEKQKKEDEITRLTNYNKELRSIIVENQDNIALGKKVKEILDFVRKMFRIFISLICKILSYFIFHICIPLLFVVVVAFVLKHIKREEKVDLNFILSNWISLGGTMLVAELLTWIRPFITNYRKKNK